MAKATVRVNGIEVELENGDAATLADVAAKVGMSLESNAFNVNREPASPTTPVRDGDRVTALPSNQKAARRHLRPLLLC